MVGVRARVLCASVTERVIEASAFAEQCLLLVDKIAADGASIVVTRGGLPIARLEPVGDQPKRRSTMGSVRLIADADESYFATGVG